MYTPHPPVAFHEPTRSCARRPPYIKIWVASTNCLPVLYLLSYLFESSGNTVVIRHGAALYFLLSNIFLVKIYLQGFLEQSIQEMTFLHLMNWDINPAAILELFNNRIKLLVFAGARFVTITCFVMSMTLLCTHKSDLGLLAKNPGYNFGEGEVVGFELARSPVYNAIQSSNSKYLCEVLPVGSFRNDVLHAQETQHSAMQLWDENKDAVKMSFAEFYEDADFINQVREEGGFASAIAFGGDFDVKNLATKSDRRNAMMMKTKISELRKSIHALSNYSFLSSSSYASIWVFSSIGFSFLWAAVFFVGFVLGVRDHWKKNDILDVELNEKREGE